MARVGVGRFLRRCVLARGCSTRARTPTVDACDIPPDMLVSASMGWRADEQPLASQAELVAALQTRELLHDAAAAEVMLALDRATFVPPHARAHAYEDRCASPHRPTRVRPAARTAPTMGALPRWQAGVNRRGRGHLVAIGAREGT